MRFCGILQETGSHHGAGLEAATGLKHPLNRRHTTAVTDVLGIAFGVWLMVALYAILHDQYIVRIAPEHFTVYHRSIPGVVNPRLQAAVLAFTASILPSQALAIALIIACRVGTVALLFEPVELLARLAA
ncbi:MAG: hypothetical protein HN348_21115, partial [Proteobacteria bacterium]|nr:hypothetical protein [Pseudomonadota bacterium]